MLGRGHNFQCYFGLTTSEITGIVSVHPLHICNSLKLFLSRDPSCTVSKIILVPLMTLMSWPTQFFNQLSYSTLCPILIGYALPSLFSATIRAFILCAYWTLIGVIVVLTVKTIFFPTRAIWDVHPLCCTSKDLEGIPIFYFPYQQLIPSLAIKYGISFHIWLWGQVGEVKSRRAETSMNWHLFGFFSTHMDAAENLLRELVLSQPWFLDFQACSMTWPQRFEMTKFQCSGWEVWAWAQP